MLLSWIVVYISLNKQTYQTTAVHTIKHSFSHFHKSSIIFPQDSLFPSEKQKRRQN